MNENDALQPPQRGSLRPGVVLNDMFEIERLIAEGGMGEVYKGVATASGNPVAIKLIRPEMASHPDAMALFRREADILHNLLHDAIPRYYVFSVEPELRRAYIAMEYVDGVSLQSRLASGPLSTEEVRVLLRRIGGALELAHAGGVVHRDISSDNIILPSGDTRRAKIVDFGIARALQASEGTILGSGFAGKYKYVSPEQLGLFGGEVTAKSDIYSFGLVLAEALRGRPIDMGTTQAELVERRRRVPDLSDIDGALRPLLTKMLSPDPRNRPASMAEVAAWGASPAPAAARSRPPRWAWAAGAAVVALAVAAVAYGRRDAWFGAVAPLVGASSSPSPAAPPPLPAPPASPAASPTASASASPSPSPAPSATPTVVASETPSVEALRAQLPPRAPQTDVALAPAAVGASLNVKLPAFADPGGKGLALHVTPAPPPGTTFRDLGGGRGALEGAPTLAGRYAFDVVAVTPAGRSARMTVTLSATAAPPRPTQAVVDLEPATVGAPYDAGLPPFLAAEKLKLRAERLPDGLEFADLGGGLSQLTGRPSKAGRFAFEVVATTPSGAEGRMTLRIEVAPAPAAPSPTSAPSPVPTSAPSPSPPPEPSLAAFLSSYDGGACFAVRTDDGDSTGRRFVGVGADRAAFQRFEAAYRDVFKRDAELRALLLTAAQCPAAQLLKQAAAATPPRLTLERAEVGVGRPLSGAVTQLAGRALLLVAIGDDGRAVKVRLQLSPDGEAATFNLGMSGDADSFGKPQALLAVASERPLAGLEAFRAGPSADLLQKIGAQWGAAGAAASLAVFKLVE